MFTPAVIDVEIERSADADGLRWPTGSEAEDDSGLGCNRQYADFRSMTWRDYEEIRREEQDLLARLLTTDDPEEELAEVENEADEADEPYPLMGLDVGVASTVVALSAARCTPVSSCNGGVFGRRHHESYPLVLFCARPPHVPLLLAAAANADVGLINADAGFLLVYAGEVAKMMAFADELSSARREFRALRFRNPSPLAPRASSVQQLDLPSL